MTDYKGPGALGSSRGAEQQATHTSGTTGNTPSTSNIVGRIREQATEQLNTQKNKATDGLGSVVHAVRDTTERLRDENHDTVARYVEQAADQLERLSDRLKGRDIGELMNDAQQLARRQPALFVGGAFAVGLLGARFLKSSAERNEIGYRSGALDYSSESRLGTSSPVTNAYGNRVPTSAASATPSRSATATRREPDYPTTEGM